MWTDKSRRTELSVATYPLPVDIVFLVSRALGSLPNEMITCPYGDPGFTFVRVWLDTAARRRNRLCPMRNVRRWSAGRLVTAG